MAGRAEPRRKNEEGGKAPGYRVPAVEKALDILEVIGAHPEGITMIELSRETGIAKSTVYNTVLTLVDHGFLHRSGNGALTVGPRLIALGGAGLGRLGVVGVATPIMQELVQKVSLTSHLAVRQGDEVVYVHRVEPPAPVRVSSAVGQHVSLFRSGVGKALLAFSPDAEDLLTHAYPREATITPQQEIERLRETLDEVRRTGVAFDDGEYFTGVRALAAPVFDYRDHVIATVAISGLRHQLQDEQLPTLSEKVSEAAAAISFGMGQLRPARATHNR